MSDDKGPDPWFPGRALPQAQNNPRTRLRTSTPREQLLSARSSSVSNGPTLLSLPDEAIYLIFHHLEAFDTSGTFARPRHGFPLALTNTRLLRIFTTHLTSIVPTIQNYAPRTLSPAHMFAVIRLVGRSLLELHLPRSSIAILPILPDLCPNLENLTFIDNPRDPIVGIADAFTLPLRSLSITSPAQNTLRVLVPSLPEELILKEVSSIFTPQIRQILLDPPKKLYLSISTVGDEVPAGLLQSLNEACPKMEEVTVFASAMWWDPKTSFLDEAIELLKTPRHNDKSKCRKMALGHQFQELLKHAHSDGIVEITCVRETFVSEGDKIYAKAMPLWDLYLELGICLSKLTEVSVEPGINLQWKKLLSGMRMSYVWSSDFFAAATLCHYIEILEIDTEFITPPHVTETEWRPVYNIREIRLLKWRRCFSVDDSEFLDSLTRLLIHFHGKSVWIRHDYLDWLPVELKYHWRDMFSALDAFEARGGGCCYRQRNAL